MISSEPAPMLEDKEKWCDMLNLLKPLLIIFKIVFDDWVLHDSSVCVHMSRSAILPLLCVRECVLDVFEFVCVYISTSLAGEAPGSDSSWFLC